jgi:hypothetical protein
MTRYFDTFSISMTKSEARMMSHQGRCDDDVAYARTLPKFAQQLAKIDPSDLARELKEYGAWDSEELSDHDVNLSRILWIAAGDIVDGNV